MNIVDRGTNGVTATIPNRGLTATGGTTGGPEKDIIHSDVSTLVGSNGNDVLTGNDLGDTLVGVAPVGTAGVKPGPAGNDVLIGERATIFCSAPRATTYSPVERATMCSWAPVATTRSSAGQATMS